MKETVDSKAASGGVRTEPQRSDAGPMADLQQSMGNAAVAGAVQKANEQPGDKPGDGRGQGPVSTDQLVDFAKGVEGTTYVFGGVHWGDCSGAVSAVSNFATGRDPWASRFCTANEADELAQRGFKPGLGPDGSLRAGWKNGGEGGGHTAATLPNGVHFEMGGARGNGQYGGQAAGAEDGQFTDHAHLPPEFFKGGGSGGGKGPEEPEDDGPKQPAEGESHDDKGGDTGGGDGGGTGGGGADGADGQKYVIKPGDTLSALAEQFLGDASRYPELARLNNIPDPDLIIAGATLMIPSGAGSKDAGGPDDGPARNDVGGGKDGGETTGGDKGSDTGKPKNDDSNKGGDKTDLVTVDQLVASMPGLDKGKAQGLIGNLNSAMAEGDITTPQRKAAFLAQVGHESASLLYFEEIASGEAYEGRSDLGNTQPGDGVRFKGRGPIQLTGRANYQAAGKALGLPLVDKPEMVATPEVGFRTTVWFWKTHECNGFADSGDFEGLTRTINGGTNGMSDRQSRWEAAKRAFGI